MKKAFTLAEVLITLGIIGVVCAITMPMLIANYQKKVTVERLKTAYSLFSRAVEMSVQQNGDIKDWEYSYSDMATKYLFPYVETTGTVKRYMMYTTYADQTNCFLFWGGWVVSGKIFSLKNGMTYSLIYDQSKLILTVDLNGTKGPNRLGRDGFVFELNTVTNKLMPYKSGQTRENLLKDCTKTGVWRYYDGGACATLIMLDGWQIKDNYPW